MRLLHFPNSSSSSAEIQIKRFCALVRLCSCSLLFVLLIRFCTPGNQTTCLISNNFSLKYGQTNQCETTNLRRLCKWTDQCDTTNQSQTIMWLPDLNDPPYRAGVAPQKDAFSPSCSPRRCAGACGSCRRGLINPEPLTKTLLIFTFIYQWFKVRKPRISDWCDKSYM